MRRFTRTLGTLMIIAGVGSLAWAFAVWKWEDPVTSLYTAFQQRSLESTYKDRIEGYRQRPPISSASLAAMRRELRAEAGRYRRETRRGDAIGRLIVPGLDLNVLFVKGTDNRTLKRGPGLHDRTFMPGQGRLIYIAGHRTTYGAPFSKIDHLGKGDRITLEMPYATFVYSVTRSIIVPGTQLSVLKSRSREEVALQACHPRFFATHRWITYGRLVQVVPRGLSLSTPEAEALARV